MAPPSLLHRRCDFGTRATYADPAQRRLEGYSFDPGGRLFEIAAEERTVRARGLTPDASARMLAAWKARELSG